MDTLQIKSLPQKSLDTFCAIFDFARGEADITCPVSAYPTACLRALERRGLVQWDTERVKGKTKRWAALTELGVYYGCEGLALVPDATKASRNRQWVKVQFDLDNADYQEAYQIAGELARRRLLAPTMRDWLLIHVEFADKDTTTFAKAYPAIHKLMSEAKQDDLLKRIEAALQNTPQAAHTGHRGDLPALQGLRAITGAKDAPLPNFEDEDDSELLTIAESTIDKKQVSLNFLRSLGALDKKE